MNAALGAAVAAGLAACSAAPTPVTHGTKEYFSEKEYGKASPRVVAAGQAVPKGGGRSMVGKPYSVAGKRYVPKVDQNYSDTGLASWYGSAFHGRLTANGEVYDVAGLTAAHPTLPLPSYVRVTNLDNRRSIVVRVNDRGPFAHDRIIDVSATVAEMLDFKRAGTAKVKVDYVGPARMDGRDHRTLLASYEGPDKPQRNTLFASLRRPDRSFLTAARAPEPQARPSAPSPPAPSRQLASAEPFVLLPALSPPPQAVPADQPDLLAPLIMRTGFANSYAAPARLAPAHQAAADLARASTFSSRAVSGAAETPEVDRGPTVQLGTFGDSTNAKRAAERFAEFGKAQIRSRPSDGRAMHVVVVVLDRAVMPETVIRTAASYGLSGAFVVSR